MKPVVLASLMLALPLASSNAAAAAAPRWVKVGSAGGSDSYIDRAGIRRSGDGYSAVSLVSFSDTQSTPDGTGYRSMKAQHVYSCERRTATLQSRTYYPQPMGKGPVGQSFRYEKFAPEEVAPGSAADGALKIICSRSR